MIKGKVELDNLSKQSQIPTSSPLFSLEKLKKEEENRVVYRKIKKYIKGKALKWNVSGRRALEENPETGWKKLRAISAGRCFDLSERGELFFRNHFKGCHRLKIRSQKRLHFRYDMSHVRHNERVHVICIRPLVSSIE